MPNYVLADGRLWRNGDFTSGRPIISLVYDLFSKSQILKYFRINFPLRINPDHIKLTIKIIEESFVEYKRIYKNDRFYILFWPGTSYTELERSLLRSTGIRCFDYSMLFDRNDDRYFIKNDGHPTAEAYKEIGWRLANDIVRLNGKPN